MVRSLSTERMKLANTRIVSVGPIKALTLVGVETVAAGQVYIYRAVTARGASLWRIAFSEDRKIKAMTLDERE